ncbi:hypothetical protein GMAR_ORF97 [Golden Marseillevirus]|uniref:hypothetical protein n=1 Tax=Golden Marseillevirus TaxID=1720526 RepID=UPI000877AA59|nr:hypothetical protein GMAR_ORF97 [Golden Marseillevirus]ALX27471.1 hypothetical protein GMAR_ORF97 [Golden Marseillevirus]
MGASNSKDNIFQNAYVAKLDKAADLKEAVCVAQKGRAFGDCRMFWVDVDQRLHVPFVVLDSETKKDAETLVCRIWNHYGDEVFGSFVSSAEIEGWDLLQDGDFVRVKKTWRDNSLMPCYSHLF